MDTSRDVRRIELPPSLHPIIAGYIAGATPSPLSIVDVQAVLSVDVSRILFNIIPTDIELRMEHARSYPYPQGRVIPICNAGENRSAMLSVILRLMYPELIILPQHGAENGLDPKGNDMWRATVSAFIDTEDVRAAFAQDVMRLTFGFERRQKFGSEVAIELELPPEDSEEWQHYKSLLFPEPTWRTEDVTHYTRIAKKEKNDRICEQLGSFMDQNLFNLSAQLPNHRIIYIPVTRRAHRIVTTRLMQVNQEHTAVVTKMVDYDDPYGVAAADADAEFRTWVMNSRAFTEQLLKDLLEGRIFEF